MLQLVSGLVTSINNSIDYGLRIILHILTFIFLLITVQKIRVRNQLRIARQCKHNFEVLNNHQANSNAVNGVNNIANGTQVLPILGSSNGHSNVCFTSSQTQGNFTTAISIGETHTYSNGGGVNVGSDSDSVCNNENRPNLLSTTTARLRSSLSGKKISQAWSTITKRNKLNSALASNTNTSSNTTLASSILHTNEQVQRPRISSTFSFTRKFKLSHLKQLKLKRRIDNNVSRNPDNYAVSSINQADSSMYTPTSLISSVDLLLSGNSTAPPLFADALQLDQPPPYSQRDTLYSEISLNTSDGDVHNMSPEELDAEINRLERLVQSWI